jgi:hypothetical protein
VIGRIIIAAALAFVAVPVAAQDSVSPLNPATPEAIAALQAQIPSPADAIPSVEAPGGAAGATMTFRRGDAVAPRITRSGVFTVAGGSGLISGTWSSPLPAGAVSYPMFFTGIGPAGTMLVDCIVISSTNVAFSAQCRQGVLNLGLLSAPLSVLAPAGTQVYALALPSTQ